MTRSALAMSPLTNLKFGEEWEGRIVGGGGAERVLSDVKGSLASMRKGRRGGGMGILGRSRCDGGYFPLEGPSAGFSSLGTYRVQNDPW